MSDLLIFRRKSDDAGGHIYGKNQDAKRMFFIYGRNNWEGTPVPDGKGVHERWGKGPPRCENSRSPDVETATLGGPILPTAPNVPGRFSLTGESAGGMIMDRIAISPFGFTEVCRMKHKRMASGALSLLLALVMACPVLPAAAVEAIAGAELPAQPQAAPGYSGGSGTAGDPYLVSTPEDFAGLHLYPGKHFRQTCDISMEGHTMTVISSFTGSYDGGGYAISDLTFKGKSDGSLTGIFNKNSGVIKNLAFENCDITLEFVYAHTWAGGIVGENSGTISDCSFSGTFTAKTDNGWYEVYGGGIVGASEGTVENCVNTGAVLVRVSKMGYAVAGGIVGYNTGTVKNCLNEGDVRTENAGCAYAGGIAGYSTGTIASVKNTGSIQGSSCWYEEKKTSTIAYVGGVVGQNKGTVSYAQNYGPVEAIGTDSGKYAYAGGIAGYNGGSYTDAGPFVVEYSKNYGDVTAISAATSSRAGGIAGTVYKNSYARYCCNEGNLSSTAGGKYGSALAGGVAAAVQYGTVTQCCNHGEVRVNTTEYDSHEGCGIAPATDAVITDCFNDGDIYSDYKRGTRYTEIAGLFIDDGTTCKNSYNLGTLTVKSSSSPRYGLYGCGSNDENVVISCYTTNLYQSTQRNALITEEQARQKETFVGYDFDLVWAIDPEVNDGHPYLRNVPAEDDPNWYVDPAQIVPVTGISLDKTSVILELGDTMALKAFVEPENALNQTVLWYSGNVSVAEVDQNGLVTAIGGGTTRIYAESEDGGFTASCRVTVNTLNPYFSGGSGTTEDPYLIATPQDLQNMTYKRGACYRQIADISLAGWEWRPIGTKNNPFSGIFDGSGYAILDLTVDTEDLSCVGLFGYSTGTVKNVRLDGCTVAAVSGADDLYCGAVAGYNTGVVLGCVVHAEVSAATRFEEQNVCTGGICGYSSQPVISGTFVGRVEAAVSGLDSLAYAGGILGYGSGASACRNSGTVTASGAIDCDCYAGGIVGCATGSISSCYNGGSITACLSRYSFAGGIVGLNAGAITGCANAGEVYASTAYKGSSNGDPTPPDGALAVLMGGPQALAGGITGSNYSTVTFCENEGYVHSDSQVSAAYSGGVAGYNNSKSTLENCKNSGEVTAASTAGESRAGGIASSSYIESVVRLCCNRGPVSITENGVYNIGIAGGVVAALQYGTMEQCCNHADVYATSTLYYVEAGGIVGSMSSTESYELYAKLLDCWNEGNVHCDFTGKGVVSTSSLAGISHVSGYGNVIEHCYNVGNLSQTGGRTELWGLFKAWGGTSYTATGCYTTRLHNSEERDALITEEESRQKETFVGYDFNGVWGMDPDLNGGRPYLTCLPSDGDPRWYSGERDVAPPESVELDREAATLHVGETLGLTVSYRPENAVEVAWIWSSSDSQVARVEKTGQVTAVSPGTAVISVTSRSSGCSASCVITVTGHEYETVVTEPTCTEEGYTTRTCKLCGKMWVDNFVEPLGHSFGDWTETKAPTCTQSGEEMRECKTCGHTEYRKIPATGHDYDAVTTLPTCEQPGYTSHTCANCGDHYEDEYVVELGHSFTRYEAEEGLLVACCDHGCGLRDETVGTPSWRLENGEIRGAEYTTGLAMIALYGENGRLISAKFCPRTEWRVLEEMIYRLVAPDFTEEQLAKAEKILCFNFNENHVPLRKEMNIR